MGVNLIEVWHDRIHRLGYDIDHGTEISVLIHCGKLRHAGAAVRLSGR